MFALQVQLTKRAITKNSRGGFGDRLVLVPVDEMFQGMSNAWVFDLGGGGDRRVSETAPAYVDAV